MLYQIKSYIKFLLRSRNRHGVHSPFVYDLITNCFYDKQFYPDYTTLDKLRHRIKNDPAIITVAAIGAGSKTFRSYDRSVKDIARYAGIRKNRQRLLYRLAKYFKPAQILELGTSLGMATAAMSLSNPAGKVTTIEACEATSSKAISYLKSIDSNNIEYVNTTFDLFFDQNNENFDLVFVDGDHDKEATLRYFNFLRKRITNNTLIIFDDIYWSRGMTEAWQEIIASEAVTVSIDTFYWGLVFFRKEQKKEHFVIRL